jgi:hypothetical protein
MYIAAKLQANDFQLQKHCGLKRAAIIFHMVYNTTRERPLRPLRTPAKGEQKANVKGLAAGGA